MLFLLGKDGIEIFLNKNMNLGKESENLVCQFLKTKNFKIISQNWWLKRFGEIDIIALKDNCYYFIEVKSLTANEIFDPSVNYNLEKKKKFHRLINYYVNKNKIENFVACLITVRKTNKNFIIKVFENV